MMTQREALTFVIEKTELPAEVKEKLEHMLDYIKNYIETGFKVAFLRAGDFKKFKKDYKDFI